MPIENILKNKKILVLILIVVVTFFLWTSQSKTQPSESTQTPTPAVSNGSQNNSPWIISTKPDPLEEAVISAMEEIEITFSHSLENEGQFKIRLDPKTDYKIVLTQDRKTARIVPQKPYELGAGYTLFILPDSKFEGVGEWKEEKIFHFQTIKYRGV